MNIQEIVKNWEKVLEEFFAQANLKPGHIVVLGCSTSEVMGKQIGKGSSEEVAEALLPPLLTRIRARELFLAVQACEHLNRALVVEEACVEKYGLDAVTVIPAISAGGAMAFKAWQSFHHPLMVESIRAHAGIDVGDTFIGMHLRPVVVPIRPSIKEIGEAHLTMARTRPRLIGGPRAIYPV